MTKVSVEPAVHDPAAGYADATPSHDHTESGTSDGGGAAIAFLRPDEGSGSRRLQKPARRADYTGTLGSSLKWIPAFAGMTDKWIPAFAGMTDKWIPAFAGMTDKWIPAFAGMTDKWIPAFAGMTDGWIPAFTGMTDKWIRAFAGMTDKWVPAFAGMTAAASTLRYG